MKGGVIGLARDDFAVVGSFSDTATEGERELRRTLDVGRVFSLPSGDVAFEGRAAVERPLTQERTEIDRGEIRTAETAGTETRTTEFVGVPGEFVVVGSGEGTFAFDLVGLDTGVTIERASFDLDGFLDAHDDASPWRAGFYDSSGNAESGVLHGVDLLGDDELGGLLRQARLNQLGLDYSYDERDLKMTASESGYVEVYRPTEFDSGDFLQYLLDEVVPHLS